MIKDFINKNGDYIVDFLKISGSGWEDILIDSVTQYIHPDTIKKNIIVSGWDYNEIEFEIEKQKIKFILHLDDETTAYLKLVSPSNDADKNKLKEWAIKIAAAATQK